MKRDRVASTFGVLIVNKLKCGTSSLGLFSSRHRGPVVGPLPLAEIPSNWLLPTRLLCGRIELVSQQPPPRRVVTLPSLWSPVEPRSLNGPDIAEMTVVQRCLAGNRQHTAPFTSQQQASRRPSRVPRCAGQLARCSAKDEQQVGPISAVPARPAPGADPPC